MVANSSGVATRTPSATALSFLEPAFSPATSSEVLAERWTQCPWTSRRCVAEAGPPFEVVFAAQVDRQVAGLPVQVRQALADALEHLALDPWSQPRYHDRLPLEMRTATFGTWGSWRS